MNRLPPAVLLLPGMKVIYPDGYDPETLKRGRNLW